MNKTNFKSFYKQERKNSAGKGRGVSMKKVLSLLGLIALLGLAMPANAAPPPIGGFHGGQMVQAGPSFGPHGGPRRDWGAPPPPPRHHYGRGNVVVGGVLARRSYWGYPYGYDCRLGWCDDFYPPPPPPMYRPSGVYINFGVPIRF